MPIDKKHTALIKSDSSSGFTLMELVFVVFLVAVISSMAYPYLDSAIDEARYYECEGQLEAIRRAKSLYVVDHLGGAMDVSTDQTAADVYRSYFVVPPTMYCPRVGDNQNADYYDPYNLYAVSFCPYCQTNKPAAAKEYAYQP